MKHLWDYEEELKTLGYRLSKELSRKHLEYALAHVRQAIRAELYDETDTPTDVHNCTRQFDAMAECLFSKSKKEKANGTA